MYKRHSLHQAREYIPRKKAELSHVESNKYIAEQIIKFGICPHCSAFNSFSLYRADVDASCLYCGCVIYS